MPNALDDDALCTAIKSHPLYAGWADYDNNPDADMLEPGKGMPA